MVTSEGDEAVSAGRSAFTAALWHEAVRQEAKAIAMQRHGVWCPDPGQVAAELDVARRLLERCGGLADGELDGVGDEP